MSDLETLRVRYLAEYANIEQIARTAASLLERELRRSGVACRVECRAKEVVSLVKKAIRKGYRDPWKEIRDKAGVRVVVLLGSCVGEVEAAAERCLRIVARDDKRGYKDPSRFDYQGVHLEAELPGSVNGEPIELQIHTHAQNLWAAISHAMSYKRNQAPEIARAIARLLAILEIVDEEVERVHALVKSLPKAREKDLLAMLESAFVAFRPMAYDEELSLHVLGALGDLVDLPGYGDTFREFIDNNGKKLQTIFAEYTDDSRHVLLSQPESLLIFERLNAARHTLVDRWRSALPAELLEGLGLVWGSPVELEFEG